MVSLVSFIKNIVYSKEHLFVLIMFNVPVNSFFHDGTGTFHFGGLLPDIEMNETPSPAIKHRPSKQPRLICRDGPT